MRTIQSASVTYIKIYVTGVTGKQIVTMTPGMWSVHCSGC